MIRCLHWGIAAALLMTVGCNEPPALPPVEQASTLHKIWTAYGKAAASLGRPPANLDELKSHFEAGDDPAKLLVSPDGQPYVIVWNVPLEAGSPENMPLVAYEATSKNGSREVLTIFGVMPLSDAEFEKAKK